MKISTVRTLCLTPLGIASLGALMSACGPQDGAPVAAANAATTAATTTIAAPTTTTPSVQAPVRQAPVRQAAAASPAPKAAQPVAVRSASSGAVQHIEPITKTEASGAGAVAGGLLGGVVGNQFGKGDGKKAMTVVGAVGGAVAGHEIEKQHNKKVVGYRVRVQLDNGETRTFEPSQLDGLKVGDRVRIEQGTLRRA
jgi:outer membrane lipoprotein SlyB